MAKVRLSDHFTYKRLIKFTISPIIMMVFTALYNVVDGFFISNYGGKLDFAGVNFIMPYLFALSAVGVMMGSGGSALIGKLFGEGNIKKANETFSLVIYSSFAMGVILSIISYIFLDNIILLLGATPDLVAPARSYAIPLLISLPFFILESESLSLFMVAERPHLGLCVKLFCGSLNIVLDAVFMVSLHMGARGAAIATMINQLFGGIIPLVYFSIRKTKSTLHLGKTTLDFKTLGKVMTNGSSELVSNISANIVSMLFNVQLIKYAGENGVASYGVLMYLCFIFNAIFFGYAIGVAPIVSYHYGAKNHEELSNILKKSLIINISASLVMFLISELGADTLAHIFVGYDETLKAMTVHGFRIFSFLFLLMGFNVFASSFFTALNNGLVSAFIAFLRTLVFQISSVMILPIFWGIDGIWVSPLVAEILALIISFSFLISLKKKYGY